MLRLSVLVSILLFGLSACSTYGVDAAAAFRSERDYRSQRAAAVASLDALVGTPTARDVSSCRTVAVGEQACGGPTSYPIYSVETADGRQVEAAAGRVTDLDRRANAQFEFVSTCALLMPPPLTVEAGVCVADQ